jgi:hypothetical protein
MRTKEAPMFDTRNELPPAGVARHGARICAAIDCSGLLSDADTSGRLTGIACAGDKWLRFPEAQPHAKP